MFNFLSREWRVFIKRTAITTVASLVVAWLFIAGERSAHYYAPFILFAFCYIAGIDFAIERVLLKKQLVLMLTWSKRWEVPYVLGPTFATFAWGIQTEEITILAPLWAIGIFTLMTLGMKCRRSRIARKLGITSDTPEDRT